MSPLSPMLALCGGALIGLSATGFLLLLGRVAGISGLAAAALGLGGGTPWSLGMAFLIGLPLGTALIEAIRGPVTVTVTGAVPLLVVGGLLVGFGTRLGNGCTSGHGVCGMARLSPRSMAATATFMIAAAMTVFITRHVLG